MTTKCQNCHEVEATREMLGVREGMTTRFCLVCAHRLQAEAAQLGHALAHVPLPRSLADGPFSIEVCPHGCSEPSGCDICTAPPRYPEHEKLRAVTEKSQACGAFLEWLRETYTLAKYHRHGPSCVEAGRTTCGAHQDELLPETVNVRELLAAFFEIDEAKLEEEKVQMLTEMRQASTVQS